MLQLAKDVPVADHKPEDVLLDEIECLILNCSQTEEDDLAELCPRDLLVVPKHVGSEPAERAEAQVEFGRFRGGAAGAAADELVRRRLKDQREEQQLRGRCVGRLRHADGECAVFL